MLIADLAPVADLVPATTVAETHLTYPTVSASDLPFYRKLGRTDLTVSCLGLGGGGGISSEDTLYAFDQGINYFFTLAICITFSTKICLEPCVSYVGAARLFESKLFWQL